MRLVILGAGGYGQTIEDIAIQSQRYSEIIFLDDNKCSSKVKGCCNDYLKYSNKDTEMYPAFGNNEIRMNWIYKFELSNILVMTLVHPLAYISPKSKIEIGTIIMPYAIVNTDSIIKKGCIINCGAIIDHGCIIEEGVHIAPGGIVKAENKISALSKVDSGEVIQVRQYSVFKN